MAFVILMNEFALCDSPEQCELQQGALSRLEPETLQLHPSLTPLIFLILYYPDYRHGDT